MQMFRARCGNCQWTYDVVTQPMPLDVWVRVARAAICPMCGIPDVRTVAVPPRDLTEAETQHKLRLLTAASSPSSANE
jgi:rubredoxin